ncbi:MAG: TetR/AcrR family transcriptional regulator [Leptolyngbyaceae cyanobacterium RM2_2_4]|nr:TetR/AcrR family transcriptional regulator [Leptolyngbyaceae cyanobacterium SM1_4_3]NJN89790.1 TetR/AcrR family transcriptional regulator [Leptolyngbyaceae cyanobacterium SL_5_14]NJO51527.1 TetR/AcrR family transcriptional regulator [Leptolyngbyaceae cyanobacterium RM2_2_4]NJO66434.1 TetR/AcrR family transcriptional regulator [Leptolyngbyaceae cyanobacterium RM1_405_57]
MPKVVDVEKQRREILFQCFDLFAQKGYANVTTRQLCQEIGVSTGALYYYFPSKKVLFEQLVDEISRQDVLLLKQATGETLAERIEALGQILIEHEAHFIKQAIIWIDFYQHNDAKEIQANPIFQQVDDRYQQSMTDLLGIQAPKTARFVWTLINGVLIEQVGSDQLSFAEQIDLLMQMLIAYFEKNRGAIA